MKDHFLTSPYISLNQTSIKKQWVSQKTFTCMPLQQTFYAYYTFLALTLKTIPTKMSLATISFSDTNLNDTELDTARWNKPFWLLFYGDKLILLTYTLFKLSWNFLMYNAQLNIFKNRFFKILLPQNNFKSVILKTTLKFEFPWKTFIKLNSILSNECG